MRSRYGKRSEDRAAGQQARARAHEIATRMLMVGGCAVAVLLAAWLVFGLRGPALAVVELAVIGVILVADRAAGPRFDRWLRGAQGEESVGAVLDGLAEQGWLAIHDVSLGRGNVDHVAIGPGGVFAVETKSHRGRISVERLDPRWLTQAYAERKLIERITGMRVEALLVFSEAWLVGSVPARRRGVTVLPARMLTRYLSRRRPMMSVEKARAIGDRLRLALAEDAA